MEKKKLTLKLSYPHPFPLPNTAEEAATKLWRVEQVTNSLDYAPGQLLDRNDVENAVARPALEVTFVSRGKQS